MKQSDRLNEFLDSAAQMTGLEDFGSDDYLEPLKLVLADYDRHTVLTSVGSQMLEAEIVGRLCGRLKAIAGFKANSIPAEGNVVEKPLIVIGMARSGTTALQRLLSRDPDAQSLQYWLAVSPMSRPPRDSWQDHPSYREAEQGIAGAYELVPAFRQIHPMAANEADECRIVTEPAFWACSMASMGTAPEYAEWCATTDATYAYRYHKRVLSLIGHGDNRRWLLKCPIHIWGLDALLNVYPDARIVFTHRDPVSTLSSTASMVYLLRSMREPNVTPRSVGREILANWGRVLDKAERIREQYPEAQFLDVHVSETKQKPIDTVRRIYSHFGIPFSESALSAMSSFVENDPDSGHGRHDYKPEDFGLDKDRVYDGVGRYYDRFRSVSDAVGH